MAKERELPLELNVNGTKLIVDLDRTETEQRDQLEQKVLEVRKQFSPYAKYPFLEEETQEEWQERVSKLLTSESSRQPGESVEDHVNRMFSSTEFKDTLLGILNAVGEVFAKKLFTAEDVKKCKYAMLKKFLYDVLTYFDIPANDLRPSKPGK